MQRAVAAQDSDEEEDDHPLAKRLGTSAAADVIPVAQGRPSAHTLPHKA